MEGVCYEKGFRWAGGTPAIPGLGNHSAAGDVVAVVADQGLAGGYGALGGGEGYMQAVVDQLRGGGLGDHFVAKHGGELARITQCRGVEFAEGDFVGDDGALE